MKEGGGACDCYCHAEHSVKELRTQSSRRKSAAPVSCVQYNKCPVSREGFSRAAAFRGRAVAPRARRRAARARSCRVVAAAMTARAGRMRAIGAPHPHSSSRGALSKVVQDIFAAGGTPFAEQDPPTLSELGVLNILLSPPRKLDVQIPRTGCSLYSREMLVARSYKAIPALSEGALMARFVRQMTVLPMALVSDASFVAFARARPEVADVWDHYLVFDDAKATAALKSAHVAMPARLIRASSLWKLAGLLMSPFVRTLYLDSDVMVLSRTYVHDLLHNSLRLHDIAMPVDIGRPGNSASSRRSVRSKYTRTTHAESSNDRDDGLIDQLQPPMFAHGLPPPCAGIIAFRRVRKVRMFFVNAAARLLNQTNMVDSTQASLGVRQTDQEMMWFELMHGPAAKQPYLLELPEEYYCPAAPGSVQSQDYFRLLGNGVNPTWGIEGSTIPAPNRFQVGGKANGFARHKAGLPNDRYLAGGVKDCHALHIHLALKRMSSFKLSRAFPNRTAHAKFAMFNLDYEYFCWERSFRGIRPACQIGAGKLVFPLDETVAFAPIKVDADYSAANSTGRRRTSNCGVY